MAKKRSRKAAKRGGGSRRPRLGRIAAVMAAAAVALLALFKYAETPRGRALLLDLGADGQYARVQEDLGGRISEAAGRAGLPPGWLEFSKESEEGQPGPVSRVRGDLPAGRSLLQLNVAISEAVGGGGGRVLRCVERRDGRVIEMEIGTRRTVTHRCTFRKVRRAPAAPGISGPALTVIVDDFGYFDNRLVREFLELEIPLTISVIPGLKHSERICREAKEAGKNVICHLPMEPEKDAGEQGGIPLVRTGMSGREIEKIVEKALETTPGASGISNHMGSKATSDMRVMESVMKVCRRRKLYFFDSYTSSRSVASEAAAAAGVPTLRNDLFLDNRGEDVRENMRKILSVASRRGRAAAIMHVRRGNPDHLRWLAGQAEKEGVRLVSLTDMIGG